jgi:hypothetical protein
MKRTGGIMEDMDIAISNTKRKRKVKKIGKRKVIAAIKLLKEYFLKQKSDCKTCALEDGPVYCAAICEQIYYWSIPKKVGK